MELRRLSAISLFDPMIFTRRAEFRYSTYNSEKKPFGVEKTQHLSTLHPHLIRKKSSHGSHKEWKSKEVITSPQSSTSTKTTVFFHTNNFRHLAKEYYQDSKRRLSSFSRKSWGLMPPEKRLDAVQLAQIEDDKKETKYMMKALLQILEDYSREVGSQDYCGTACATSPNKSRKHDYEAPRTLPFVVPTQILSKYQNLPLPKCKDQLERLLRPLIYLDVRRKGRRRVRTIVIELYTEACPEVVMEFVRRCSQNDHESFSFQRSFPALWIEAGLKLDCDTLQNGDIEYDMRALNHDAAAGILSFPARYVHGFWRNNLEFSLSVDPLPEMSSSRVAFGVVILGLNILDDMQVYDMKNFDQIQDYEVVQCGLVVR